MFNRIQNRKLLVGILAVSVLCFFFSSLIATPIGTLADKILLAQFIEQWPQSHDPRLVWESVALSERIFAITTSVINAVALILGAAAAWTLYQRKRVSV